MKNFLITGYTVTIRLTLEDCQIVDLYVDEYGRVTYNSIKIFYQILLKSLNFDQMAKIIYQKNKYVCRFHLNEKLQSDLRYFTL